MSMVKTNFDGTMAPAFSIGKRGPTISQGTTDPNTSGKSGVNGDLYVRIGTSPKLYQFRASEWVSFDAPVATPTPTTYKRSFTNADLASGMIAVTHNLNEDFPSVEVYNNIRVRVGPDEVFTSDANNVTVSIGAYGTISGTWTIVVRK